MTKTKTHSRAAAILLAMLMMFGTLFASMSTVSAANEGTLNIHKLSSVGVAAGSQDPLKTYYQNPTDSLYYEYLAGAEYTVYKIGTFAETNVGGTISTVYTADPNALDSTGATIALGSATAPGDIDLALSTAAGLTGTTTAATTATGPLSITSGLDTNGVYLIVESTLPAGVATGADFIITVPMYNKVTSTWDYAVDAYPKNTATDGDIDKTVTQVGGSAVTSTTGSFYANVGDIVTYSVDVTVPTDYTTTDVDPAKNYTKFNLIDESSQYLEIQNPSAPALLENDITIAGTTSGTFIAGTDYTALYTTASGSPNKLQIVFTAAGLAKIQAGETLTVSYNAEILVGAAAGSAGMTNKAWIEFTKGSGSSTITPNPSDPVPTVKIYSYGVQKINDATTPAPLAGASFVLAKDNGSGGYDYLSYNTTTEEWDVVAQASAQVFTTSTSGTDLNSEAILQFKNLDPAVTYYLIETAAPSGYIQLLSPVTINATDASTDAVYNTYNAAGAYVANTGYSVKVTNVSVANGGVIGGGGLPTTGGNGIYLFLIVGAVLMGSAVVLFVKFRKKNHAAQ